MGILGCVVRSGASFGVPISGQVRSWGSRHLVDIVQGRLWVSELFDDLLLRPHFFLPCRIFPGGILETEQFHSNSCNNYSGGCCGERKKGDEHLETHDQKGLFAAHSSLEQTALKTH